MIEERWTSNGYSIAPPRLFRLFGLFSVPSVFSVLSVTAKQFLLLAQDDVHQGRDVGNRHAAVRVDIGHAALRRRTLAEDDVHQRCHVGNRHAAVAVDIAAEEGRLRREVAGVGA